MKTIDFQKRGEMNYISPEIQIIDLTASNVLCASNTGVSAFGIDGLEEDEKDENIIWY